MPARLRSAVSMSRSNVATSERVASTRAFKLPPPALRPRCATFRSLHRNGPRGSSDSQHRLNPGPFWSSSSLRNASRRIIRKRCVPAFGARPSPAAATWQPPSASRLPAPSICRRQHSAPRCATFRSPHRNGPLDSSDSQHRPNPRRAVVLGRPQQRRTLQTHYSSHLSPLTSRVCVPAVHLVHPVHLFHQRPAHHRSPGGYCPSG